MPWASAATGAKDVDDEGRGLGDVGGRGVAPVDPVTEDEPLVFVDREMIGAGP